MKIEKSKDSMSRIINDYIDGAFPLPEHKGPKNISFGENKRVKDLVKSKVRAGMKYSDIFKSVLDEKPLVSLDDEFYVNLLNRYINVIVPIDNTNDGQLDLRVAYKEKALEIFSLGYDICSTFRYMVGDKELPSTTVVMIEAPVKQYAKAV